MKKKKKVNKRKLYSRIFLLLVIVFLTISLIKGFSKKNIKEFEVNVIVSLENVTGNLSKSPYINKDKVLYLSLEDISKLFDKNIYYEENSKKIITTYGTKVAAIGIEDNTLEVNSAKLNLSVRNIKSWRYIFCSNFGNDQYL